MQVSEGCEFVFKALLVLFNLLLLAFGAANLLAGVALLTGKNVELRLISHLEGQLAGANQKGEIDSIINKSGLLVMAAYAFCAVGGVTLLVSFCGCCGACRESVCMLYFYTLLLSMLMGLQLVVIVVLKFFRTSIQSEAQDALHRLQDKYYVPLTTYMDKRNFTSEGIAITHLINIIQIWFECCGAKKVGDIVESKRWKAINRTWIDQPLVRPLTCCKLFDRKQRLTVIKPNFEMKLLRDYLLEPDCPFTTKRIPWAVHNSTCGTAIVDFAMEYSTLAILASGGIACAELFGILLACCLISIVDEYEDDD